MIAWAVAAVGYAVVRTALAAALVLRAPRFVGAGRRLALLGQAGADACLALFPVAYVSGGFRHALGLWWVALWLFAALWEGVWFARSLVDLEDEVDATMLQRIEAPWQTTWAVCFLAPSLVAGGLVALDAMLPARWSILGPPAPALACLPAAVRPGDTLVLTMAAPHGGELGVVPPGAGSPYLIVIPHGAPPRHPGELPFERMPELHLAVDSTTTGTALDGATRPVFAEAGVYELRVSEAAEVSPTRECRVSYAGRDRSRP